MIISRALALAVSCSIALPHVAAAQTTPVATLSDNGRILQALAKAEARELAIICMLQEQLAERSKCLNGKLDPTQLQTAKVKIAQLKSAGAALAANSSVDPGTSKAIVDASNVLTTGLSNCVESDTIQNSANCTDEILGKAATALGGAVAAARVACDTKTDPDEKKKCLEAVDKYGGEATKALQDIITIMGPVIAACAATMGAACALAGFMALMQIFSMAGGGTGKKGEGEGTGDRVGKDEKADLDPNKLIEGNTYKLLNVGGKLKVTETATGNSVRIPGWAGDNSTAALVSVSEQADAIGDAADTQQTKIFNQIRSSGSIKAWLNASGKRKMSVTRSPYGNGDEVALQSSSTQYKTIGRFALRICDSSEITGTVDDAAPHTVVFFYSLQDGDKTGVLYKVGKCGT